jgi:hypothetical protein
MKSYFTFCTIFVSLICLQLSCKKNTTEVKHEQPKEIEYFPNAIGSWWKYERYDSLNGIRDTVTATIVDTTTFADGSKMKIWKYTSNIDSTLEQDYYYAGIRNDTLRFISPYQYGFRYPLPLKVGIITDTQFDSLHVIQIDSLTITSGIFDSTYQIYFSLMCGDECSQESRLWFAPTIGFVKINHSLINWPFEFRKEFWQLLSYHLVPPK